MILAWRWLVVGAAVALVGSACTRANPEFCAANAECGAGSVCDLDGTLGADKNACVEVECTPGEVRQCVSGDREEVCAADGQSFEIRDCGGFGCNDTRNACNECVPNTVTCGPNVDSVDEFVDCNPDGTIDDGRECLLGCQEAAVSCVDVDPSNNLRVDLMFIDANPGDVRDLVLGEGFVVDTDNAEIRDGDGDAIEAVSSRVQGQGNGLPDILVFRVRSLSIEGDVSIFGDLAAAFVSDRDIAVNALVDVAAGDVTAGQCVGGSPELDNGDASGGGGAGHGSNGNNGGDADGAQGGNSGSAVTGNDLDPLTGGCRGGVDTPTGDFSGGIGGGAIQLVTRQRLIMGPSAQITVAGRGGGFEGQMVVNAGAASGGGSGGGVLIEAPVVTFAGGSFISANGGGGGCQGAVGERGPLTRQAAAGASCAGAAQGDGGGGGAANTNPTAGQSASGTDAHGGGGGGAVGIIRINQRAGEPDPADMFFSPDPDLGAIDTRP